MIRLAVIASLTWVITMPVEAAQGTYEIVTAGKSCSENSRQQLDCEYKIGTGLDFSIDGVGFPDTGITFMKSSFDGDFYATYGLQHGCVIVKPNPEKMGLDRTFDYAFVSPKNGKVYRTWQECQDGF